MDNGVEKDTSQKYEDPDFVGKDSLQSYLYYKHKHSTNPITMYRIFQQRIIFARDLIVAMTNDDNEDEMEELLVMANSALKIKPALRKIVVDDTDIRGADGKRILLHKVTAEGMTELQSTSEKYVENLEFFIKQQYEVCIDSLSDCFNEMDRQLSECDIFKVANPSANELLEEFEKKMIEKSMEEMGA